MYVKCLKIYSRALQPVATCRQLSYIRPVSSAAKPAILIMTSLAPCPALQMYVRTDTLPRLIYRDVIGFDVMSV